VRWRVNGNSSIRHGHAGRFQVLWQAVSQEAEAKPTRSNWPYLGVWIQLRISLRPQKSLTSAYTKVRCASSIERNLIFGTSYVSLTLNTFRAVKETRSKLWHKFFPLEVCTGRNFWISPSPARWTFGPSRNFIFIYVSHTPATPKLPLFPFQLNPTYLQHAMDIVSFTMFLLTHKCH
jgi:hypothetical protein